MKNTKAFTLVELIVVVTILAILSTIGFVSYSGYLAGVRDTNRIAQLKAIGDALHLYSTNKNLPIPDDKLDIKVGIDKLIGYQGEVGKDVIETIGYTAEGLDPKDKTYFSYYLTKDKKYFQLMAFLEEEQNSNAFIKTQFNFLNAIDYDIRYPRVEGSKLGILTGTGGAPLQELITGEVNLDTSTNEIKSYLSNTEINTGVTLSSIDPYSSCERLYEVGGRRINGLYTIDPEGNGTGFKVYCDMENDGGGWTLASVFDSDPTGSWVINTSSDLGNWTNDIVFGLNSLKSPYNDKEIKTLAFSKMLFKDFKFIRTTDKKNLLETRDCNVNTTLKDLFINNSWQEDNPTPLCIKSNVITDEYERHTFYNTSAGNFSDINYGSLSIKIGDSGNPINDDTSMITVSSGDVGYIGGIQTKGDSTNPWKGVSNGEGNWNNPEQADYGVLMFIK